MNKLTKPLFIFLIFILIGLSIRYFFGEESKIWEFWGVLDTSSAVALAILAFLAYKNMIKEEDTIPIFFNIDGKEIDTNLSLLRKNCTRGEIVGVLGMMQKDTKKRFSFSTKELPVFLKHIQDIQKGKEDKVIINMTKEEFEQFEVMENK